MHSQSRIVFPEIADSAAFNTTAAQLGWPILCDSACAFEHPMLRELLSLWQKEAGTGIPSRNALTARKLQPFMRNIAIYERIGTSIERRYRIRLMGSGIVQYYGEHTGKHFEEAVAPHFLDRWYAVCDATLLGEKPLRLLLRADTFGKPHLTVEYICAPLAADGGGVSLVLVGMTFDGRQSWATVEANARLKLTRHSTQCEYPDAAINPREPAAPAPTTQRKTQGAAG